MSMPDAAAAKEATGYERGTITPFGSTRPWPVVADEQLPEVPQVGAGASGYVRRVARQLADQDVRVDEGADGACSFGPLGSS
jgi:Cys-tRNA(Pro)/Cys-tRNA(Cys) deacylase